MHYCVVDAKRAASSGLCCLDRRCSWWSLGTILSTPGIVLVLFVVNGNNELQRRGESRAYSSDQFTVLCWDSIVRTWLVLDRAVGKECSGEESQSELTAQVGLLVRYCALTACTSAAAVNGIGVNQGGIDTRRWGGGGG